MWKKGSWILHHDNTLAYNALSVETFLAKHKIPVLEHPPCSPDLALSYFFFFISKDQVCIKRKPFESIDAVKAKATEVIYQKRTCSIASNSGKLAWSCVGIGEGTTLKVITFPLCDLLNNRFSSISLVILWPFHVHYIFSHIITR
jgi:hypothetical protein